MRRSHTAGPCARRSRSIAEASCRSPASASRGTASPVSAGMCVGWRPARARHGAVARGSPARPSGSASTIPAARGPERSPMAARAGTPPPSSAASCSGAAIACSSSPPSILQHERGDPGRCAGRVSRRPCAPGSRAPPPVGDGAEDGGPEPRAGAPVVTRAASHAAAQAGAGRRRAAERRPASACQRDGHTARPAASRSTRQPGSARTPARTPAATLVRAGAGSRSRPTVRPGVDRLRHAAMLPSRVAAGRRAQVEAAPGGSARAALAARRGRPPPARGHRRRWPRGRRLRDAG